MEDEIKEKIEMVGENLGPKPSGDSSSWRNGEGERERERSGERSLFCGFFLGAKTK